MVDKSGRLRLPKYWPILYVVYRLRRVYNSFDLQKYLYLAKVDGNAPIEYVFVDDYCGPRCASIKQDAISLGVRGYLKVSFENRWVFEITEEGARVAKELMNSLPVEVQNAFDHILEEYSSLPVVKLRDYVYDAHQYPGVKPRPRAETEYEELKKQIKSEINLLLHDFSGIESNANTLFLLGSLDYCMLVLKRENLAETFQKDNLITLIDGYVKKVMLLRELLGNNPELVGEICLNDLKEDFELIQEASEEYKVLPALYEEGIDLSVFVDVEE
ncbi:hypothetical protein DRN80_01980 [Methanosarcinales archaeon]|nr:MAG: hypothetical protein DRN80_01980 [Methanosarcinales archaeon]